MAIRLFSSSVSTILNTTNQIPINKTKTQQWIFGMIIGSAPFLLIVICWICVSFCISSLMRFYQCIKKRHRYDKRTNINKNTTQIDAV